MPVKSALNNLFTSPLVVKSSIAIATLAIFFMGSAFTTLPDPDMRAKEVNLSIREIGHRLLLLAGDSTSVVLPVTETKKGTFLLQFENEFFFSHHLLMEMSGDLLPKTQFPSGYAVTVHDCLTSNIVYGFQFKNTAPDVLPCRGRSQARGCYTIEFSFPDFYESVEQQETDIDQLSQEPEVLKVDPPKAKPRPEKLRRANLTPGIDRLANELKSFKVDRPEVSSIREEIKTTSSDIPLINLVYCGALVLLGVTVLIARWGKSSMPIQHQDKGLIKQAVQELPGLGRFLFDGKRQLLLLGNEVISLTDKECKILELFNKNFGELIPRETLMQEVWINEGVITGRSLDVFVSKLRKKLSSDPELRITNVHGKGYKLEMPGIPIP